MKAKDWMDKSAADCRQELMGLLEERFRLRMQHATGQLANTARLRGVRRDIARLRTLLRMKGGE